MPRVSEIYLTKAQTRLLAKIGRGENIWYHDTSVQSVEVILQALINAGYVYLADIENETYALSFEGKRLLQGVQDG